MWERFGAWLLEPAVLKEFQVLIIPSADSSLDMEFLRGEFEAAGLDVKQLP